MIVSIVYKGSRLKKGALPFGAYKRFLLKCNRESFYSLKIDISTEYFKAVGLNPRFFVPGIEIHLVRPNDFAVICRVIGVNQREVGGIYLPPAGGEEKRAVDGELEKISQTRRIALPYDHEKPDLIHELAHDILLCGALSKAEREGFFRLAISEVRRVLNTKADSLEAVFIREVASSCNLLALLTGIKQLADFEALTHEHRMLACELFAYAIENSSIAIPQEITNYLKALRIRVG